MRPDGHVTVGQRGEDDADRNQGIVDCRKDQPRGSVVVPETRVTHDLDIVRVDEPFAGLSVHGSHIRHSIDDKTAVSAGFDKAAVPAQAPAARRDLGTVINAGEVFRNHLNTPAVAVQSRVRRCHALAAQRDQALAQQADPSAVSLRTVRANRPGLHHIRTLQDSLSAGLARNVHHALVDHVGHGRGIDGHVEGDRGHARIHAQSDLAAVLGAVDDDLFASGRQSHGRCPDHAIVFNPRAQQVGEGARRDGPVVDHLARVEHPGEIEAPGIEVLIGQIEGRGDQPTDIDARTRAEQDAVGVDQVDVPVREQAAEDLARVTARHAVQNRRIRARLDELHRLVRADAKRIPVDDRTVRALIDRHLVADGLPRHVAASHRTALRQRQDRHGQSRQQAPYRQHRKHAFVRLTPKTGQCLIHVSLASDGFRRLAMFETVDTANVH